MAVREASEFFRLLLYLALSFSILISWWQFVLIIGFKKRHSSGSDPVALSVSVLRPLHGATEMSRASLETSYRQNHAPFEICYGVDSREDPAISVVERLRNDLPRIPTRLRIGVDASAANRKMSKLALMAADCKSSILVAVDQDIAMPPDHLNNVLAYFSNPKTGLVTSLYRLEKPTTWASALELLMIHADFFPSVLTGEQVDGGLRYAFGATLAVRREVLKEIGGFESLVDFLADDHELGARVREKGHRIALSSSIVEHAPGALGFKEYCARQIRAARTNRFCNPVGYALSVLAQGFPWIFGMILVSGFTSSVQMIFFAWILSRGLAAVSSHLILTELKGPFWPLALLPVHEFARFVFWVSAFTGNKVRWGGRLFQVERDGRMREIGEG